MGQVQTNVRSKSRTTLNFFLTTALSTFDPALPLVVPRWRVLKLGDCAAVLSVRYGGFVTYMLFMWFAKNFTKVKDELIYQKNNPSAYRAEVSHDSCFHSTRKVHLIGRLGPNFEFRHFPHLGPRLLVDCDGDINHDVPWLRFTKFIDGALLVQMSVCTCCLLHILRHSFCSFVKDSKVRYYVPCHFN